MIAVSVEFKALWKAKHGVPDYERVAYKRRYKAGGVYQNEAAWKYLTAPDFIRVGDISMELDVPTQNEFRTSVVTLIVANEYNKWIETTATSSFWGADDTAADGYKCYKSIFAYQVGYKLAAGTIEWVTIFTHLAGEKPRISGSGAEAEIPLYSKALLLETADAEAVAEDVVASENCIPPAGDGSNKDFESTSTGVDHFESLEVNGVAKNNGSDLQVSNDNQVACPGDTGRLAITMEDAPGNGLTVILKNVKKWLTDQRIETLLGLLADEAGITAGSRTIVPALFPGGLSANKTINTQVQWEAGTVFTNVDTVTKPGSITRGITEAGNLFDDFADNDYVGWTLDEGTADASGGYLSLCDPNGLTIPTAAIHKQIVKVPLSWSFKVKNTGSNYSSTIFFYVDSASESNGFPTGNGYAINIHYSGLWGFYRGSGGGATLVASLGSASTASWVTVLVERTAAGVWNISRDGVLIASVSDVTYVPAANGYFFVRQSNDEDPAATVDLDDIYIGDSFVSTYESEDFDLLSAPTAFGVLQVTEVLNGGTTVYSTATSADGVSWDAYVAIGGAGEILSTPRRHLKVKVVFTPISDLADYPEIQKIIANFQTTDVFISLAVHSGKTCMEKFQEYVKLCDYQMRFNNSGNLIVEPKTVSAEPAVILDQENGIIDVTEVDYGIPDRVVRAARVRCNGFVETYDDADAGCSASVIADGDELSTAVLDEDLSDVLLANNVDIAAGRAQLLYENSRRGDDDPRPPVRIRALIWNVPWLELSDITRLSFFDHPKMRQFLAADPLNKVDSPYADIGMGAPSNVITNAKDWKVLSYTPNGETNQGELLVEEVV